jgi:hypothetical protein
MNEPQDVCECYQCILDNNLTQNGWPLYLVKFILCTECGNKRCPKATDHRHKCTGSNETGQPGSRFQ